MRTSQSQKSLGSTKKWKSASAIDRTDSREDVHNDMMYDSDLNTHTTNSSIHQAKNDLMQLGIELDDELIERLQKNLGIDRIFKVAHDAAHVIKSNVRTRQSADVDNPFDIYGQSVDMPSEMSFRHVPSAHNNTEITLSKKRLKKKNDISSIFTLNQKSSIVLLKQLENRDDTIEPQYRPLIDQMLEYLRLLYLRSPKKFLYRLLNKKVLTGEEKKILFTKKNFAGNANYSEDIIATPTSSVNNPHSPGGGGGNSLNMKENEELQLIYKWILQSRYFNYQEFEDMMKRILPPSTTTNNNNHSSTNQSTGGGSISASVPAFGPNSAHPHLPIYHDEVIRAFFLLICDEKRFESTQKRKVVDLWNFLTLLKISSDESRRSYDNTKSKLANDVEFWKRDNNIKYLKQSMLTNQQQQQQQETISNPLEPNIRNSWMTNDKNPPNNRSDQVALDSKKYHRMKNSVTTLTLEKSSLAHLLGQNDYQDKSRASQGRNVLGTFSSEVRSSCDVPISYALNSPSRDSDILFHRRSDQRHHRSDSPSPTKSHKVFLQDYELPIKPANDDVFDSSKVSFILGNEKKRQELLSKQSSSSSVAAAAANNPSSFSNSLYGQERKTKSIGCYYKEQYNNTTIAVALGRETASSNNDATTSKKDRQQYETRQKIQDNRLRMNHVSNLYWDNNEKPSVANALKQNNSFVKRTALGTDYYN